VKPDPRVVDAIAAESAAEKLVLAMKTVDDFIAEDPTGRRAAIFKMMTVQEMSQKGNSTVVMTEAGSAQTTVPVPTK
jgi:uridylate kinase